MKTKKTEYQESDQCAETMRVVNGNSCRCFEDAKFVVNAEPAPHDEAFGKIDMFRPPLALTGGQIRTSGYLLWQTQYAEYFFSPKLWPEFTKQDFEEAVDDFMRRERKFGR